MARLKETIKALRGRAILDFARCMSAREFAAALNVASGWAELDPSAEWRKLWKADADDARRCISREGGAR